MSAVSSMLSVAPSSRWQIKRSGLVTSMSPAVAIIPAVTSAGPVADRCRRLGPSPSMRSAICLTLRTMSVTSSRTPVSELNSCSTPSILIEVIAAPWSDDKRTRRSELPKVMPKPRSSGSATNAARRRTSPPDCFFSRLLGFFSSCQFFALTAMLFPWQLGAWGRPRISNNVHPGAGRGPVQFLDAAPFRRADADVRDRRDVADRGDLEANRLERAERTFAARSRTLDLDFEGADAMFGGLLAGVFGRDLGRVRSRLAAALEAHHPGRAPRDGVALGVGDGDHGIVEAGVHVGHAGRDVLALPSTETLRCLSHSN